MMMGIDCVGSVISAGPLHLCFIFSQCEINFTLLSTDIFVVVFDLIENLMKYIQTATVTIQERRNNYVFFF